MKTFLLTLILGFLAGPLSFAETSHHHDHPSVHGMLMVGSSKIYASHLPMFHTPHDYQVILELKLSKQAEEIYLASLSQGDETVFTLVPETFVLPEMIKNPNPFKAQIYKGHFERGGTMIAKNVTVEITKVLYFKKFNPSDVQPPFGQYLLFGNEQEQFLAHSITAKPDFDQVMKVTVASSVAASLKSKGFVSVTFKSLANSEPVNRPGVLVAETPLVPQGLPIDIITTLYFETGDLSF